MRTNRRKGKRGAVAMEVVVLAVLIAAAAVIAVVVFGQTFVRSIDVAGRGLNGNGDNAATAMSCEKAGYRKQAREDVKEAVKFAQGFSDAKEGD